MSLGKFLKEKMLFIILQVLFLLMLFLMAYVMNLPKEYSIAVSVLLVMGDGILFLAEYPKKKTFYQNFLGQLEELEQKYLITELIQRPEFLEGQILCDALYEIDKAMQERIYVNERARKEFQESIELWIHEIKVPISSLSLMNYNQSGDFAAQKLQIGKLSFYVEQILYLSRADNPQKDYLLKKTVLESIVNKVVVNHKDLLIGNGIAIGKENLHHTVVTDTKWLEFILGQIVNNSIKYVKPTDRKISFYATTDKDKTVLVIEDHGIGVGGEDLPRVFEKTFTGHNGRKVDGSTGMGLYICKKLCDKLGHAIWMESEKGRYTRVLIAFGKEGYYLQGKTEGEEAKPNKETIEAFAEVEEMKRTGSGQRFSGSTKEFLDMLLEE